MICVKADVLHRPAPEPLQDSMITNPGHATTRRDLAAVFVLRGGSGSCALRARAHRTPDRAGWPALPACARRRREASTAVAQLPVQ